MVAPLLLLGKRLCHQQEQPQRERWMKKDEKQGDQVNRSADPRNCRKGAISAAEEAKKRARHACHLSEIANPANVFGYMRGFDSRQFSGGPG
ncbi:unnamed protein product [Haemonchus placei]|uniref:Secreted protein n=1 Tax=Haemonchus placei TaxID=6290 RepID=A0A0N4WRT4_HAEPC|nr:unnamed protein product [Haemonchus placei]